MSPKSKRQRKQLSAQSLKVKQKSHAGHNQAALDLLSDELREELEGCSGAAALILPSNGGAAAGAAGQEEGQEGQQQQPQLSKAEQRKLRQVQQKKERREHLTEILSSLDASKLGEEALGLMRPLHQRGAKETKRQRLRRELRMQRAGLELGPDSQLMKEREVPGNSDSEEGSGSSDEDEGRSAAFSRPSTAAATAAAAASASGRGDESAGSGSEGGDDEDQKADGAATMAGTAMSGKQQQQQQLKPEPQVEVKSEEQLEEEARAKAQAEAEAIKAARREIEALRREHGITDEDAETVAARRASAAASAAAAADAAAQRGKERRVVSFSRPADIEEVRSGLPVTGMEQEVMEAIGGSDVVVLCGETGCGKTTQVPQFLLEAGYGCKRFPERAGLVGVTQPRRVAAVSTATRVAQELGEELGQTVGYQIRYEATVGSGTSLKFMTDGILLRELQDDFLLKKYSAIIIDEAHERSLNTDLLLGMLSRIVPLRRKLCLQQRACPTPPTPEEAVYPLKLIIMSATLRTSDFTENKKLFPSPPPVINVPARQYPVTIHFSRRTELHDYVGAAFRKVCRIHRELPAGGILVFLTGQREVEYLCHKLRKQFAPKPAKGGITGTGDEGEAAGGAGAVARASGEEKAGRGKEGAGKEVEEKEVVELEGEDRAEVTTGLGGYRQEGDEEDDEEKDDYDEGNDSGDEDEEDVIVLGGEGCDPEEVAAAEKRFEEQFGLSIPPALGLGQAPAAGAGAAPVYVLPLYAMLPQHAQKKVFEAPPDGHRMIVVATNVAETSLTIPGMRYVVDAGRSKQKLLEGNAGLARYEVRWISQSSSLQRAGRAGRTGPGHCYRLFSSAFFNDTFPQHTPPEIANTPLEGVVLMMKTLGVEKVQNFPFPSPPEPSALKAAHACLEALSALNPASGALTPLGRAMALFPISPRHARMLLEVVSWQQQQQQQQQGAEPGADGRQTQGQAQRSKAGQVPGGTRAAQALPYALALAAALSVDSPFVHLDNVSNKAQSGEGKDGKGGDGAAGGEDDGDDDGEGRAEGRKRRAQTEEEKQAAKEAAVKAQRASAAHARLRCIDSDAISAMRALCEYEAAGDSEEYCRSNFLHSRNLREMADLHRQLVRTLATMHMRQLWKLEGTHEEGAGKPPPSASPGAGGGVEGVGAASASAVAGLARALLACVGAAGAAPGASAKAGKKAAGAKAGSGAGELLAVVAQKPSPPTRIQECLRRAVAAGWADQVARRVRSADYIQQLMQDPARGLKHAVRYASCSIEEEVYLHPRSALHKTAPTYVVYTQVVRTLKRPYMAGVTTIEPGWLTVSGTPLAILSPPVLEPAPSYQRDRDMVIGWHDVTYGKPAWSLPRCSRRHPDPATRAAVFASALLEGRVFPSFGAFLKPLLAVPGSMAARPEMRGVARVGELVGTLQRNGLDCGAALAAAWSKDPTLLRQELLMWVGKPSQARLLQGWTAAVTSAAREWQGGVAAAAVVTAGQATKGSAGLVGKAAGGTAALAVAEVADSEEDDEEEEGAEEGGQLVVQHEKGRPQQQQRRMGGKPAPQPKATPAGSEAGVGKVGKVTAAVGSSGLGLGLKTLPKGVLQQLGQATAKAGKGAKGGKEGKGGEEQRTGPAGGSKRTAQQVGAAAGGGRPGKQIRK